MLLHCTYHTRAIVYLSMGCCQCNCFFTNLFHLLHGVHLFLPTQLPCGTSSYLLVM